MINKSAVQLPKSYLFSEIDRRVSEYAAKNPNAKLIRMGIGDVTLPLPKACVDAMHRAADEMSSGETFRGYGPGAGYAFLREAIASNEYKKYGADISADEVFVSEGAKSDCANIQELFDNDCVVGVSDPVYPVYVDSNGWSGRLGAYAGGAWERLVTFPCTIENGFVARPPKEHVDLIYLCFPNNPTGAAATRKQLAEWVAYAKENRAVIVHDSAYRAFIVGDAIPRTIYEIEGAKECAIEIGSYSKSAGFTGTRCGWTVVPKELAVDGIHLRDLWIRRQTTKFNGVAYIIQRAAEAIYTEDGAKQASANIDCYRKNAEIMLNAFGAMGLDAFGGVHSPYIWLRCPDGYDSWGFFDMMLSRVNVVCTPGAGFGSCGEGYARITAFNTRANTEEAMERIRSII